MVETGNEDAWVIVASERSGTGRFAPSPVICVVSLAASNHPGYNRTREIACVFEGTAALCPEFKQPFPEEKPMHTFRRYHRIILVLAAALVCLLSRPAVAQEKSAQTQQAPAAAPASQPAPEAKPADVASPDAILAATYDVISGPPGERDWNRFYSLFMRDARLISTGKGKDGAMRIRSVTPEGYAKLAGAYFLKNGFFERESARKAERYGNIMQIFSTYESRNTATDEKPFARGINSFQLYFDGKRWWVVTIFWLEESADNPIPKEYLPQ